jgi:hypothetical protein
VNDIWRQAWGEGVSEGINLLANEVWS